MHSQCSKVFHVNLGVFENTGWFGGGRNLSDILRQCESIHA